MLVRRCGPAVAVLVWLAAGPAFAAQPQPINQLPEKPLTGALGGDLLVAARGAARLGIKHLKAVGEKTDHRIWFVPIDGTTRIPVGWKTVSVTRPVYKQVMKVVSEPRQVGWKWVWVTEKDPKNPYAPVGRRRVRRPVYKYVKVRKEVSVRDGNKTRVVQEKRRVYQESDPYQAFARWLEGINALALYTLLAGGEPPDSPAVTKPAEWLYDGTLEQHGLPDTTYEISLFLLCFSRLDRETYGKYTAGLLHKLLRGQIPAGPRAGLWGSYSVDFELLKTLQVKEMRGVILRDKYAGALAKSKQLLPSARSKREKGRLTAKIEQYQKTYDAIMKELKKIRAQILELSREFSRGTHWARRRRTERIGGDIRFYPGALYDARTTRRADLPNTHLALMALREAKRQGYLKRESSLGRAAIAAAVRAAGALAKAQEPDGSWGYAMHEHHAKPPTPVKGLGKPPENTNAPCLSMTAAGLACLDAIGELVGSANAGPGFRGTLAKARAAAFKHLHAYSKRGLEPGVPECTQYSVLYYCFTLATALNDSAFDRTRAGPIPEGVLCRVLFAQEDDGSWPREPYYSFGSGKYIRYALGRRWRHNTYETRVHHKLINTCFAVLFLLEAARPTLGAQWAWSGEPDPALEADLESIRTKLAEETHGWLRLRTVPRDLPDGLAGFVPTLVARGRSNPRGQLDAARSGLGKYLDEGGLLIAHTPPRGDFGEQVKSGLRRLYSDVEFRPLPEDHAAYGYVTRLNKPPKIEAAWRGDRAVAVLLNEGPAGGGTLSRADVRAALRNLLAARAHTQDLTPASVIGPKEWPEVEKDVEAALARVRQVRVEPPKKDPDKEPKKEPEKPPKEEPKGPDKEPEKEPKKEPEKPDKPKEGDPLNKSIEDLIREINKDPDAKKKPE